MTHFTSAAKTDCYPLPKIEDINFLHLSQESKLDLTHAYNQIELDEVSKQLAAINTSKGVYSLQFAIASAPAVFQWIMESMPGVFVYLDNILVTGMTEDDHLKNLEEVLSCPQAACVHLKCFFMLQSVEYLSHRISE